MKFNLTSSFFFFTFLLLFISCTTSGGRFSKQKEDTLENRIISYETRARSFQALANAQSLSSPHSSPNFRNHGGLSGENLRMVYLQEASRYRTLAKEATLELEKRNKSKTAE